MNEVASKANVSQATVSLILNDKQGKYGFSPDTIRRVKAIARELGYRPNRTGAALSKQSNPMIGILSGGYRMECFSELLEGVSLTIEPRFSMIPTVHCYSGENERKGLENFIDMRLSGIVAFWSGDKQSIPLYRQAIETYGIPMVLCDRRIPELDIPYLRANDEQLAHMAASTLIEHGHRRILALVFQQEGHYETELLLKGHRRALSEHGLGDNLEYITTPFETQPAYERDYPLAIDPYVDLVMRRLEQQAFKYTGIWVQDDLVAYHIMHRLSEKGIRVPDDVSIVGLGNHTASSLPQISLTTVGSVSFVDNGSVIARTLLDMIDGKKPQKLCIERKLKVFLRNSVKRMETP